MSFCDYPDPSLRPLRDLDFLLTPQEAVEAERIMLSSPDFERQPGVGSYGMEYGHQLPEIRQTSTGTIIELHHRLNARGWAEEPLLVEAMHKNAQETVILGRQVRVPSAEDNFLHLLEHATRHHLFANGPLIFADIHYLAQAHDLDWDEILHRIDALGLSHSFALVAELARESGALWVPHQLANQSAVTPEHCQTARAAMFAGDEATRRQEMLERLATRSGGRTGWLAAASRAFQPDPAQLSLYSGQSPQSALRWLGYPQWLLSKAGLYAKASGSPRDQDAAKERRSLSDWLERG